MTSIMTTSGVHITWCSMLLTDWLLPAREKKRSLSASRAVSNMSFTHSHAFDLRWMASLN